MPDAEVLSFAISQDRVLLTQNRLHFLRLHRRGEFANAGIVICTDDPDFRRLAARIQEAILASLEVAGKLLRVYRPGQE